MELANRAGYTVHHYCSWTGKGYTKERRGLYGRFEKVVRGLHYVTKKAGFPELLPYELPFLLRRLKEERYDLVHFHDLSSAISPWSLIYLSKKVPVIWTLHDCSPFTGGCLYPMECEKYKSDCKNCPQIGEWPIDAKIDLVFLGRKIKAKLHRQKNIFLITPSQWMSDMAFSSGMLKQQPTVISNGVDTETFQALDKHMLKKEFSIPLERPVILISAGNILDERKGTRYAVGALEKIADLNPYLIVVGVMDERAKKVFAPFDYYEAGYVSDNRTLNRLYAAADIFLFCSLADNQPLVVLETMASGTPIVGFRTGGIPEMVQEEKTGTLVPQKDIEQLAEKLRVTIAQKKYIEWGRNARERAVEHYRYEKFLQNHIDFYEDILSQHLKERQHEF